MATIAGLAFNRLLKGTQAMKRVLALVCAIVSAACTEAPPPGGTHVVVFFEPGSTTPRGKGKEAIAYFIDKYAQETKDSGRSADVDVVGHTDATGEAAANEKLSLRRAQVVADLLAEGGVARNRLKISGRGDREPAVKVGPSSTARERAEALAQNRRVEIVSRP